MPSLRGVLLGAATVAITTGVRLIVGHWLPDADALYLAAVSLAAWRWGVPAGLVVVLMSVLAQAFFFLEPYESLHVTSIEETVQLAVWAAEAGLLCLFFGALESARRKATLNATRAERKQNLLTVSREQLRAAHDALESTVRDRTAELAKANDDLRREIAERDRVQRELRATEEQLRQTQKMEAVGRLAGGVAHDFNNLLSVILGYGKMALEDLRPDSPLRADMAEIVKAGERATELTGQLLTFSRQQVVEPSIVDVGKAIAGMSNMLRRLVGEDIDLRCHGAAANARVRVGAGHVEQVVMNLAVNARDAMPSGGRLTIETSEIWLDDGYAEHHVDVKPGAYVMLAVTDTGVGMDKETQAKIFEPFFTTKDKGKGTGLGLSTVFGIVRQSGGHIWAYSEPGKGATFKVYLPRVDAAAVEAFPSAHPASTQGSETILLVEDEPLVRAAARSMLLRRGYVVLEAAGPLDALQLSAAHDGRIHLVLSDVVMPEMSGPELARRLTESRPDLKVLCMSGYTDHAVVTHGVLGSDVPYLQKPLTPETLARKVRDVLSTPPSQSAAA